MEFLNQVNRDHAQGDGRTNDPEHMEGLEAEHLLYPEPGNGLGLCHHNTEQNSGEYIF